MASSLLSLSWRNHQSTFSHGLSAIRSKELYCDVTIACDGKFYPLHKFVLSTCSDYFEKILMQTTCKNPVIVLKDIESDVLEVLLSYMYVGEVNVLQDKLADIVNAAECLKIKGLAVPDEAGVGGKKYKHETDKKNAREMDKKNAHEMVNRHTRKYEECPPAKKRRREISDVREEIPAIDEHFNISQASEESINSNNSSNAQQSNNEMLNSTDSTMDQSEQQQQQHKVEEITLKLEPVDTDELSDSNNDAVRDSNIKHTTQQNCSTDSSDPLKDKSADSDWHQYESMSQEVDDAVPGSSGVQGNRSPTEQDENRLLGFPPEDLFRDGSDGNAHNMCTASISSPNKTTLPPLPEFSGVLTPFLEGTTASHQERRTLNILFRNEVIRHLDTNNLNLTGNSAERHWYYQRLGQALYTKYPNIHWFMDPERPNKLSKPSTPWSAAVKNISRIRKSRRYRAKRPRIASSATWPTSGYDLGAADKEALAVAAAWCELKNKGPQTSQNSGWPEDNCEYAGDKF